LSLNNTIFINEWHLIYSLEPEIKKAHKLLIRMSILQQQKWIKIGCKIRKFKVLNLALVDPFWLSLSWKPSEIEAICQPILPEAQFFNMKCVFYFRFQ
jgi:hypothetical protein